MRRILVVGNETLGSDALRAAIAERLAAGPSEFHLVVPASPSHALFWSEGEANTRARGRLDEALARMHAEGIITTGEVGDANPVLAVEDVLRHEDFDEIIVSTFPPGISRWIRQDLPHRLARHTAVPVTHVVDAARRRAPAR